MRGTLDDGAIETVTHPRRSNDGGASHARSRSERPTVHDALGGNARETRLCEGGLSLVDCGVLIWNHGCRSFRLLILSGDALRDSLGANRRATTVVTFTAPVDTGFTESLE